MERKIGVIGGSGVYEIAGLENAAWITVDTPFGPPSLISRPCGLPGMTIHGPSRCTRRWWIWPSAQ